MHMRTRIATLLAIALTALLCPAAYAQKAAVMPAQNFYFNDYEWPLPGEGTTTMTLNGMKSVHAVWITFLKYSDGKPVIDGPIITLLEGMTVKWAAPEGGCSYVLQLVNANPPVINMIKPPSICAQKLGAKVVFKIVALP